MSPLRRQLPVVLGLVLAWGGTCLGQAARPAPEELDGVGVEEHLGGQIPLELSFIDDHGVEVKLADYFTGDRPVILSLGYFRCPMLCNYIWNGLVDALKELEWTAGQEFELITVSIDPRESTELAAAKKASYITSYERPSAASGWHFLTGEQDAITALAEAVGFRYRYLEDRNEYAHTAVLFVISPDGKIMRYLYGVMHQPKTVRLSLIESSEGKIGSTLDRVLLYCFHYDAAEGRYTPAAMNLMRAMGAISIAVLGSLFFVLWRYDRRRKKKLTATGPV